MSKIVTIQEANAELRNKILVFGGEGLLETEADIFEGQKARVTDVVDIRLGRKDEIPLFRVNYDFSEFEEHNKALSPKCYFDSNSDPTLKYHEHWSYPRDRKSFILISPIREEWPFKIEFDGKAIAPVVLAAETWNTLVANVGLEKLQEWGIRSI